MQTIVTIKVNPVEYAIIIAALENYGETIQVALDTEYKAKDLQIPRSLAGDWRKALLYTRAILQKQDGG